MRRRDCLLAPFALQALIAQSGKLAPTASGLENFVSQGERRAWYR